MKPLDANPNGVTAGPKVGTEEARRIVGPAEVVLNAVKWLNQLGATFLEHELLRAGPVSSPETASRPIRIFMEAGLLDEAEALYLAMVQSFPRHPGSFVGLAQIAMRRRNWREALERWDNIMAAFGGARNPNWLSGRAMVLLELGRHQEATDTHADLVRDFPDEPAGYVGLAQIALRQRFWPEALSRCDEILARFGAHAAVDGWRVMRAGALLELGKAGEAEAIARGAVDRSPGSLNALLFLLGLYATTGRPEIALRVLDASPLRDIETIPLIERRLDILIRLKRFETWSGALPSTVRACVEVGARFNRLLAQARKPDALSSLFGFVPSIYEGGERQRILNILLERAAAIRDSLELPERVPLGILIARIRLALRDRKGVVNAMRDLAEQPYLGEHGETLRRVATVLSGPRYPDCTEPKLFGIGLSKTGTTTLASALTLLGFNTLHWLNPLTGEVISDDDLFLFDAFTDTPISARFESFYDQFPNSKFILTTRSFDGWVKSMSRHWRRHLGMSDFDAIKAAMKEPRSFHYGIEFRDINSRLYFDYGSYREAFDAYEQRVRRFFRNKPADRFLELNILGGEGWPKLCAFVGRDVPSVAFPWENREPSARAAGSTEPPGVRGSQQGHSLG